MSSVIAMDVSTKERRFLTANDFYLERFGSKVFRVSLNGGFSCPNKDGRAGFGGCIYCSPSGAGDFSGNPTESLGDQYRSQMAIMRKKWPDGVPLIYFQANTNTDAPTNRLRELFEAGLALDDAIVGIVIATRPDCLSDETLDLLEELSKRTFVCIELGLQSIHPETARWINRGHDLACFDTAVNRLFQRGLLVVAHVINSLKGETVEDMKATIRHLNGLPIHGVKIHMLHIMKQTRLAVEYALEPFPLLTLPEYAELVADQIELLRGDIVVYRVTGDAPADQLIAPEWTRKKFVVQNEIDKVMRRRHSFQASRFEP
jgi:hypothetical protein